MENFFKIVKILYQYEQLFYFICILNNLLWKLKSDVKL